MCLSWAAYVFLNIFGAMTQGKQGEYIGNNFLIIIIIITVPASSWVNGKRKNRNGKVRKMGKKKRTKVNYRRFTQTARKILIWSIFYFQFSSISFFPFTFTRSANLPSAPPRRLGGIFTVLTGTIRNMYGRMLTIIIFIFNLRVSYNWINYLWTSFFIFNSCSFVLRSLSSYHFKEWNFKVGVVNALIN